MSVTLDRQITRWQLNLAKPFTKFVDQVTSQEPKVWKANDLRIELGLFNSKTPAVDTIFNLSTLQSLTVDVREKLTSVFNLASKTISSFNNALTINQWMDGTSQHAVVEFSSTEMNLRAGTYIILINAIMTDGDVRTFATSSLEISGPGSGAVTGAPPENPGIAISKAEADALYQPLVTGIVRDRGLLSASGNPNYPAALKGEFFHVSVAGKVGGAFGKIATVGDTVYCLTNNAGGTEASVGANWQVIPGSLGSRVIKHGTLTGGQGVTIGNGVALPDNSSIEILAVYEETTGGAQMIVGFPNCDELGVSGAQVTLNAKYIRSNAGLNLPIIIKGSIGPDFHGEWGAFHNQSLYLNADDEGFPTAGILHYTIILHTA